VVKIPFGDGRSGAINAIKRKEPQRNVVPGLSSHEGDQHGASAVNIP
jgi:hypothetical protein